MSKVVQACGCALVGLGLVWSSGCGTISPPPLTYVAVTRPVGPIKATGPRVTKVYNRGGPFFLNYGFRPAPDIRAYLEKAQGNAKAGYGFKPSQDGVILEDSQFNCLKNTDVKLVMPIGIEILFFGWCFGDDLVTANH